MDDVEDRLRDVLPKLDRLGYAVCFDLGDEGKWTIDGRVAPARLAEDLEDDVSCTIRTTAKHLFDLIDGRLDPMLGYAMGKIKVKGSTGVAMKLVGALN
ncbi:SCP2 sterol-binding domain-containing protein [Methyloraptor flagellatus]|jgi:putative sterol carrier protein|uniref:SCP2 sterol-binding domain-containing protein n=1 Tax=Methyloraptor flagellatus TaxID=3162530 RepID=A0AAU7X6I6_9HYPH